MVFISRSRIPIFACVSNSIGPKIRGLKHFNVEVQGFEVISRRFLFVIKLTLGCPLIVGCYDTVESQLFCHDLRQLLNG